MPSFKVKIVLHVKAKAQANAEATIEQALIQLCDSYITRPEVKRIVVTPRIKKAPENLLTGAEDILP